MYSNFVINSAGNIKEMTQKVDNVNWLLSFILNNNFDGTKRMTDQVIIICGHGRAGMHIYLLYFVFVKIYDMN